MGSSNRFDIEVGAITTDLKKGLADARAELNKFKKETESTDWKSVLNAEKVALAQSRTEAQNYRTEVAKLTLEKRKGQTQTEALSGSYREAQQRLTALGKTIREAEGGFNGSNTAIQKQVNEYNQLNNKLKAFDATMGNNQRNVGNYALGLGNASGVTMEFTRIIQDAPYGMIGIGNNIQQLTANWQQYAEASRKASLEQGKTLTTGALLRGALSSLISPASLLSLGVAALTSGWTIYTMWAQKSAKATREKKEETQKYIETLSGLQRAQANGLNDAQKELTTLDQLYKATQNLTLPMKTRKEAADELIKQYPEQLKGLSQEEILAGKASKAYDTLSKSITATAIATASASKLTENAQKQLNNYLEIIDKQNEANKLQASIEKTRKNFTTSALGAGVGASGAAQSNVVAKDSEKYSNLLKDINSLGADNLKISKENEQIQKLINTQLESGASITGRVGGTLSGIGGTVSKIANDSNSILKDSLNYYDAKLLSIQEKYDKIYATVKDEGLLKLAKENEYAEKLRVNVEKLLDATKQLKGTSNITITGTLSGLPTSAGLINSSAGKKANDRQNSTTDNSKLENRLARTIENGLKKGIEDILGDIDNLGSNFYDVFSNVFGKLSSNFTSLMSGVISTSLADGLSEKFSSGEFELWEGLGDKTSKALVAGATLGGKILGGLISQSSAVGQAGAGLLSGAGAGGGIGALFSKSGGIWGAAIGGVIGAISGIFGSSKAKKAEELQRQQLEEQKKQTALMERQQLLSYTSSVIGGMTSQGVISSIDRDAFGNLVAIIKGSQLQLVLDRAKSERGS